MKTNQLTTTVVIEIGHDIDAADAIVTDLKRGGFDARLIPNSRTMKCSIMIVSTVENAPNAISVFQEYAANH